MMTVSVSVTASVTGSAIATVAVAVAGMNVNMNVHVHVLNADDVGEQHWYGETKKKLTTMILAVAAAFAVDDTDEVLVEIQVNWSMQLPWGEEW